MQELFDTYTADGQPLGVQKPRDEVHCDGDWHKAVHVWIVNSKQELLLQKRALTKDSNAGLWDISFAGHISAGDTPVDTAVREAKEELGLMVTAADLTDGFECKQQAVLNNGTYFNNEINLVYVIRKDIPLDTLTFSDGEVSEVAYVPLTEVRRWVEEENPTLVPHPEEFAKLFAIL